VKNVLKSLIRILKGQIIGDRNIDIISALRTIMNKDSNVYKWNIEPGSEIKTEEPEVTPSPEKAAIDEKDLQEQAKLFYDPDREERDVPLISVSHVDQEMQVITNNYGEWKVGDRVCA
jgi:hypothetical protein